MIFKRKIPQEGVWESWFAWHPVKTPKYFVWLDRAYRQWNKNKYWKCIDPYDPGISVGGWDYAHPSELSDED